jgi:riboflavin-specific deaminase-like protein
MRRRAKAMPPMVPMSASAPNPELSSAWAALLAAARGRNDAALPDAAAAWLVHDEAGGWSVSRAAPPAVRPLLDLYAPLCVPGALTIAHLGQSLDGCIATEAGDSYYVTGPANVRHLHRLRALCDAVIVGAGTVARDDPRLTVRHVAGTDPVRVVLDPRRGLALERRVFLADSAATLLIYGDERPAPARHGAAEIMTVPCEDGRLRLDALLAALRVRGLAKVFVEGGGVTVSGFLEAGLLDRLHLAIAPLVTGRGRPGLTLAARRRIADCLRPQHRVFTMGGDVLYDCDLRAPPIAEPRADDALARVL